MAFAKPFSPAYLPAGALTLAGVLLSALARSRPVPAWPTRLAVAGGLLSAWALGAQVGSLAPQPQPQPQPL